MATRLPRCFAAAAAAASATSSASSGSNSSRATPPAAASSKHSQARGDGGKEPWRREAASTPADAAGCTKLASGGCRRGAVGGTAAAAGAASVRPSIEALEASLQGLLGSVPLVRIAHADGAAAVAVEAAGAEGEGDAAAAVSELEDGDKPEYIQRADEQAAQMRQQLRRPAQFADQFLEVSQLTQVHSFEGFRLDMSKAVTPTFFTSHNVFFGNPQFPSGHYQGTLTVVGESETMVRASMDADCNVSMDAHAPLGMPGLAGKLTVHQGKNDVIQGTALYHGDTCSGQISLGTGPTEISYNQAVTPHLSMGGQGQFSSAQQAVGLLYGFKYNTPSWAVLGRLIGGGANVVTAQYLRRVVPGRVTLGAEYQAQLGAGSQMMVGAEFQLKQSKMSASVDSNGKVDSTLELKCGTFPTLPVTLTISSSLDHSEDKQTFGLALTCGQ
ncbi:Mitochondrial TOM complex subunit, Tom40 homolog [Ectocarpus siliculosus]|uniref:Mitochondrial TOM complex subunit, Tom40 homolog n=1 Tax=Ectocarpus siliculosus TaxID=2880 RepID=D7G486_ECTSI|nr:Mitochondrial TOM complex subunit, Tom40 homolog [Ectocarpus siliculosus]|eukprot:CBJ27101.1 Mitochondrial TOM complex subunit, Tom40 homolog [Ectocarpus siliculosus]